MEVTVATTTTTALQMDKCTDDNRSSRADQRIDNSSYSNVADVNDNNGVADGRIGGRIIARGNINGGANESDRGSPTFIREAQLASLPKVHTKAQDSELNQDHMLIIRGNSTSV